MFFVGHHHFIPVFLFPHPKNPQTPQLDTNEFFHDETGYDDVRHLAIVLDSSRVAGSHKRREPTWGVKWREPHQPVRWTGRLDVFMAVCLDRGTDQGFLFRCPEFLGKQSPLFPLVRRSPPNQYKVGPEPIAINGYKWCEITSISKVLTTPVISNYPK